MTIRYEFETRPGEGDVVNIVDGVDWLRMPLPFVLSHINLWLLRDQDGIAIVDTGINSKVSRGIWQTVLSEQLDDARVARVIVTHLHPDHVGCAGWLTREHDVELWMTREEYLLCRILVADTGRHAPEAGVRFYRAAGFSEIALLRYQAKFGMFGKFVAELPESYRRIMDGEHLVIGGSDWEVVVGRGHSPEHACFYNADQNLLLSGDQVLPTISPNVSVHPTEPHANPLKAWIESLSAMKERLPEEVLVLPAHGKPFRGAHERLDQLIEEHRAGLNKLYDLCAEPRRAIDVFPALFKGSVNDGNLIMATGESIAHLNYLMAEGALVGELDDGVLWYRRA